MENRRRRILAGAPVPMPMPTCPAAALRFPAQHLAVLVFHARLDSPAAGLLLGGGDRNIVREVGVIAHACGIHDPRQLGREHCRIVVATGRSLPLSALYPEAEQGAA